MQHSVQFVKIVVVTNQRETTMFHMSVLSLLLVC